MIGQPADHLDPDANQPHRDLNGNLYADPHTDPYGAHNSGDSGGDNSAVYGGRHHRDDDLDQVTATIAATDPDSPRKRNPFRPSPYVLTNGRTKPSTPLDLMSLIRATRGARAEHLGVAHALALRICQKPVSVAEVAAHLRQPITVAKVILSDLVQTGAVIAKSPPPPDSYNDNPDILEALLDGLRKL